VLDAVSVNRLRERANMTDLSDRVITTGPRRQRTIVLVILASYLVIVPWLRSESRSPSRP
jgi:hypothetical protein